MTEAATDSTLDAIVISPQVREWMVERVHRAVAEAGHDPADLEAASPKGDSEGFVSLEGFVLFLEAAAQALQDPLLGLRLGLSSHPKELGALGFVILNSPTLGEAAANIQRYLEIHQTRSEITARRHGRDWILSYRVPDPRLAASYQDGEYTVGTFVSGIRILTADAVHPTEVHLRRGRPANASEYEDLLSTPVRFGEPRDAVVVDEAAMAAAVVGADADLLPVLEAHAQNLIEKLPGDDELLHELRRGIAEALQSGPPRLEAMARRLGMSERTLQRRLDERGLGFHQVVEQIREGLAREYLVQRELSLTEVAFLLGYSELSAFGRAFRRWTGQSPRHFREAAARSPSGAERGPGAV